MTVPTLPPCFIARFCIELIGVILVFFLIPLFRESWIKTLEAGGSGRFVSKTIGTCYRLEANRINKNTVSCRFCDLERSERSDQRGCGISTMLAS